MFIHANSLQRLPDALGWICKDRLKLWRRRRIGISGIPAALSDPDFVDNEDHNSTHQKQGAQKKPQWLRHAIARYLYRVGGMHSAEHGYHVLAHGNILAQPDRAKHADQIAADRNVVVCFDPSEEAHNIVVCLARDVHIPEEDHDVALDFSLGIDAAKEAHGVMHGGIFANMDVRTELHRVTLGKTRLRDKPEGNGQQ
jgi:hypothetical protein